MGRAIYIGRSRHNAQELWLMEWRPELLEPLLGLIQDAQDLVKRGAQDVTIPNPLGATVACQYTLGVSENIADTAFASILDDDAGGMIQFSESRERLGLVGLDLEAIAQEQVEDTASYIVVTDTHVAWGADVGVDSDAASGPRLTIDELEAWMRGEYPTWEWPQ